MKRERMRQTELPEYMKALAESRREKGEVECDALIRHVCELEFMDELAAALGICTDAEDWWDSVMKAKRAKLLTRANMLNCLRGSRVAAPAKADYCDDCPPPGYPTDETRCSECPRRSTET